MRRAFGHAEDGEDRADRDETVDVRRTVERVEGDYVLSLKWRVKTLLSVIVKSDL